jgi:hypothetical protein
MSEKFPEPPEGYYKEHPVGEYTKGLIGGFIALLLMSAVGGFIMMLVLSAFDSSNYAMNYPNHAWSNKFNGSFIFVFIILGSFMLVVAFREFEKTYAVNRYLRKEWIEKCRIEAKNAKIIENSKDKYEKSYQAYLPKFKNWQSEMREWENKKHFLEGLKPSVEEYHRHAQGLCVEFEALWREVELQARLVLEMGERDNTLALFAQAFRETLGKRAEFGLFSPFFFAPPFQSESFKTGHIARMYPDTFYKFWLEAIPSVHFVRDDDRFLAIRMDLPEFTLPDSFPFIISSACLFLPEPPRKPEPTTALVFDRNGVPLPVQQVVFSV